MTSNNHLFGIELEFEGVSLDYVNEQLSKNDIIPYVYLLMHKYHNPKYDVWYLDYDDSVSDKDNDEIIGGELSSRILYNKEEDWFEIYRVVELLKKLGAYTTNYCGLHFTFDIGKSIKNRDFIKTLSMVLAVYETDIELFYMGDKYNIRTEKDIYAKSIGLKLRDFIDLIDDIDVNSKRDLAYFFRSNKLFTSTSGVNLIKYGLMEIRYPNGTLDCDIIHNDGDFSFSLINAIENGFFDKDYLAYRISQDIEDDDEEYRRMYIMGDSDRFKELVDTIEKNNVKKKRYLRQYENVVKK